MCHVVSMKENWSNKTPLDLGLLSQDHTLRDSFLNITYLELKGGAETSCKVKLRKSGVDITCSVFLR